jgi:hypothetical protein
LILDRNVPAEVDCRLTCCVYLQSYHRLIVLSPFEVVTIFLVLLRANLKCLLVQSSVLLGIHCSLYLILEAWIYKKVLFLIGEWRCSFFLSIFLGLIRGLENIDATLLYTVEETRSRGLVRFGNLRIIFCGQEAKEFLVRAEEGRCTGRSYQIGRGYKLLKESRILVPVLWVV